MPSHPERHRVRYGIRHKNLRKRFQRLVESGQARCARCHRPIAPDEPWDLGHADEYTYSGPEHRRCNRRAGGKARARQLFGSPSVQPPTVTSRRW